MSGERNSNSAMHEPIDRVAADRYDLAKAAFHLAGIVYDMADGGQVIAINARWGAGKTSLVKILRDLLEGHLTVEDEERVRPPRLEPKSFKSKLKEIRERNYRFVDFNAWMEESAVSMPVAICDTIVDAINDRSAGWLSTWTGRFFRQVRRNKFAYANAAIGTAKAFTPFAAFDAKFSEKDMLQVKAEFETAVAALRADEHLIIVIDDVDRMSPNRLEDLILALRWVRQMFDGTRITFLLLYDHDQVTAGLARTMFAGLHPDEARNSANAFLEKIIQFSFPLPGPAADKLLEQFEIELKMAAPDVFRDGGGAFDGLSRWEAIRRFVLEPHMTTPRAVIRLATSIRFVWSMKQFYRTDGRDLVAVEALRLFSPDLFDELSKRARAIRNGTALPPAPFEDKERILAILLPAHFLAADGGDLCEPPGQVRARAGFGEPALFDHYLLSVPGANFDASYDIFGLRQAIISGKSSDDPVFQNLIIAASARDILKLLVRIAEGLDEEQKLTLAGIIDKLSENLEGTAAKDIARAAKFLRPRNSAPSGR